MLAKPLDPRKVAHYLVEMDGIEVGHAEEVTLPKPKLTFAQHGGGTGPKVNTASGYEVDGNLVIKRLLPADKGDKAAWNWITSVYDPKTGRGALSSKAKKDVYIHELSPDDTILNTIICHGCLPETVDAGKKEKKSNENVMEEISCKVDWVERT